MGEVVPPVGPEGQLEEPDQTDETNSDDATAHTDGNHGSQKAAAGAGKELECEAAATHHLIVSRSIPSEPTRTAAAVHCLTSGYIISYTDTISIRVADRFSRRMAPPRSARFHTAFAAAALATIVIALALVSVGYLATVAAIADLFHWCRGLAAQWVPPWLGWAAIASLAVVGRSMARTCRRYQRARTQPGDDPVVVLASEIPVAYSVAGRPGQVVVSAGMLARLDRDERRALFAHEQSHLRNRHHRYLWLADLAASVPLLSSPAENDHRFRGKVTAGSGGK